MSTTSEKPPAWVAEAVFYQIFPDRFARSASVPKPANLEDWDAPPTVHGYKGGDLIGVVERLDWLSDLGVNAISLNPIFQSPSNHRYHTHDYYRVDPVLGGDEAFHRLVEACHRRGIRVILDGVFNHCGRGFYRFNDLLENGPHSPWVDWFLVNGWPLRAYDADEPNYQAWKGLPALPEFNTDNPRVREYLFSVAEYWTEQGIDGWRLDVPAEITTPGFWEEFRDRTKAINPDLFLLGEIWRDASAWTNDGKRFDGTMNYLFAGRTIAFVAGDRVPLKEVESSPYPTRPPADAAGYRNDLERILGLYTEEANLAHATLLSSHDVPRVLTACGEDRVGVRLALLLQMTFPGAPTVFYGDEVGMSGGREPACRGAFPWDGPWDRDILDAHRRLIALRHRHPALRSAWYRPLCPSPGHAGTLFVAERSHPTETLLVAVNTGDVAATAVLSDFTDRPLELLWGEGTASAGDGLRLTVPARAGALWKLA